MKRSDRLLLAAVYTVSLPVVTFALLAGRGLPEFAAAHLDQVILWVYSVTWLPALLSGALMSAIVSSTLSQTPYFHKPFDFGRSLCLGAVVGALTQALSTWAYRGLTHHPFSHFWIAGATIAGCLTGAVLVPLMIKRFSSLPPVPAKKPPVNSVFARTVFKAAGLYGLVALLPQYLLERKIGLDFPPPITHPEYFYGFVGVGVAWQVLFLTIARDPIRFRPVMPAGALEKILFAIAVFVLYAQSRVTSPTVFFACLDLILALLFIAAYKRTPPQ